jgi:ribosomal protein S27AE
MAKGDSKSPSDAALLGILFVGLGHFYLGMWGKGIGLILITIIATIFTTFFIAPVFWIISCVWAYYDAKSYNREWGYSDFGKKVTVEDLEDVEEETDESVEGETEKPNFCPNCGKPLLQDDKFCSRCGKGT